ncbi:hypothetical protein DFJ74DRAFT_661740 [Hyaloraphidium curvatum]|nr:hypothetical protein DFJ74DRAFT_661740 [Hyaloraphidium curvatum]
MAELQAVSSGNHTARLRIRDKRGLARESRHHFYLSGPPPVVQLTSPEAGRIYYGSVTVSGTASARARGTRIVSVEVSVPGYGNVLIATSAGPFSKQINLDPSFPGLANFIVFAQDSTGAFGSVEASIQVASSPQLAYAPYGKLPHATSYLRAVDGTKVPYFAEDPGGKPTNHVLDLATGASVDLQGSTIAIDSTGLGWSFAGGAAYTSVARGPNCTLASCVLRWDASGGVANLTEANPIKPAGDDYGELTPKAKPGRVVAASVRGCASAGFTAYDPASGILTMPGPEGLEPSFEFDFYPNGTDVELYITPQRSWTCFGAPTRTVLLRSSSATNATTRISDDVAVGRPAVGTDGQRVAWKAGDGHSLVVMPAPEGRQETVSINATAFALADGVLAWCETPTPDTVVVKASVAGGPAVTLQSTPSFECDVKATSGLVAYAGTAWGIHVWSPSSGDRKVLDFVPDPWLFSGSRIVFLQGYVTLYSISV